MSKKNRRQRRRFPWPVLVFGGIVLVAAVLFLASTAGRNSAANNSGDAAGTARISVDPAKIDYGYVKFGNDETFRIKVTNTGDGVLRFEGTPYINVLEGC